MPDFNIELMNLTEETVDNLKIICNDFTEAIIRRNINGTITYFNNGAENLYGYSKEEVVGKTTTVFIPKCSIKEYKDAVNKVYNSGKAVKYETIRKNKEGELITVSVALYPITHEGKNSGLIGIIKSVIDKEIYRLAINGGSFGVWDRDLKKNTIYYSNRCKEMLGFRPDEISDSADEWKNRIHKDDVGLVRDKLSRHYNGEEYNAEYRLKCKDGSYKWVRARGKVFKWDEEGNPRRMTGTIADIDEEMLARKKNEENENRLIWLYNSLNVGIAHGELVYDSNGGLTDYECLHVNKYMKDIIGVETQKFHKNDLLRLFAKSETNLLKILEQSVNKGENTVFEYYNKSLDRFFHCNIYSPNLKQFVLLVSDISELKKNEIVLGQKYNELQAVYEELQAVHEELATTEEELRVNFEELEKANEKAEAANKAKSQFLANMSHELRTPLNGILGCTQLLKLSKLTYEQKEDVMMIEESSNRLLELINEILNLSKIESGKIELNYKRFNFSEQMEMVIKDLTLMARNKNIEILYYIDPFINKELIGDYFRLKQIINNLISNAVKFTDQGHVFFKVKQISKTLDETKLEFIVEDTGKGIKEDFKNDIFNKFSQEESNYTKSYGGTGLGLAISKELVRLMGGDIGFESEADKGSRFYFTVKLKNAAEVEYAEENKYYINEKAGNRKVLVVEDNDINLKITAAFLKQLKYEYHCSHNGQEAVNYLEKNKADIVLMDVQMPVLNGCDATRLIREKESGSGGHTTIIAMTAYAMEGDRKKFIDCGMDDYISKPFNIDTLGEMLNKY